MTRLRRVIWLFAFLLTLLLAFVLRNTIRDVIILPLTYAWWETTLLYFAIPELVKWSILLVLLGVLVVLQLIPEFKPENRGRPKAILNRWLYGSEEQGIATTSNGNWRIVWGAWRSGFANKWDLDWM
jgi:hypothetical protein